MRRKVGDQPAAGTGNLWFSETVSLELPQEIGGWKGMLGDGKRESLLLGNHHFGFACPVAQVLACKFLPLPCLFGYLRELKLALP